MLARLTPIRTLLLFACLAAPRAWADDSTYPQAPPRAKAAPPASARTPRPKSYARPSAAGYQPTVAQPTGQANVAASMQESVPADEPTTSEGIGDVSPDELFPSFETVPDATGINPLTLPIKMAIESGCGDDGDECQQMAPATGLTLSSGRWFNRGCWYAKQDLIYLERSERGRHREKLMQEFTPSIATTVSGIGQGSPPDLNFSTTEIIVVPQVGQSPLINPSQLPPLYTLPILNNGNYLPISPSLGFSPGARLTIGTYLGTDPMNRDSAIEFTFQGLNHWSQQGSFGSTLPFENTLFNAFTPLPQVTSIPNPAPLTSSFNNQSPGFNFDNFAQYTYNSSLNTYEVNFKVSRRMGRDRTVLTREGIWARVVTPQLLPTIYGGLRVISYNEGFTWLAHGVDPTTINGNYQINTHNTLFGPQFGGTLTYQHENWRFTGRLAGGALANWGQQHSIINGFDTFEQASIYRNNSNSNTTLSMMCDFGLNAVYLFRPNMGLRFGYQILVMSNLALADHQITFQNFNPPIMNQDHGLYFQGVSTGLEFTW